MGYLVLMAIGTVVPMVAGLFSQSDRIKCLTSYGMPFAAFCIAVAATVFQWTKSGERATFVKYGCALVLLALSVGLTMLIWSGRHSWGESYFLAETGLTRFLRELGCLCLSAAGLWLELRFASESEKAERIDAAISAIPFLLPVAWGYNIVFQFVFLYEFIGYADTPLSGFLEKLVVSIVLLLLCMTALLWLAVWQKGNRKVSIVLRYFFSICPLIVLLWSMPSASDYVAVYPTCIGAVLVATICLIAECLLLRRKKGSAEAFVQGVESV
ncbi:MAG: hypothetical protein ACI4U2_06475 [Christensenellaceae bacterium]